MPTPGIATIGTLLGAPGLLGAGFFAGERPSPGTKPHHNPGTVKGAVRCMAIHGQALAALFPEAFQKKQVLCAFIRSPDASDSFRAISQRPSGTFLPKL